ncbi:MAG: hypothetical protein JNL08_05930 [Planctomycetes bacterium]|nr:hypothetical protein [Planctomycetota bacterium]
MKRLLPVLCVACLAAIGATGWSMLGPGAVDRIAVPAAGPASPPSAPAAAAPPSAAERLHAARRRCSLPALDAVVTELRAQTAATAADAAGWRLLAEALLERAQLRTQVRGVAVGQPMFAELPAELARDLDDGLAAVARARALGDTSADLYRIEACLMSQHITGLATALRWNPRIEAALAKAAEQAADDPRLHTVLGLRKLLAPKLFGHDPERALEHFEFAARRLADDERPAVFAAMASYLQKKRQQAVAWLEQAVARNPNNVFARVVLRRVQRDEPEPFARDVTADEHAAAGGR